MPFVCYIYYTIFTSFDTHREQRTHAQRSTHAFAHKTRARDRETAKSNIQRADRTPCGSGRWWLLLLLQMPREHPPTSKRHFHTKANGERTLLCALMIFNTDYASRRVRWSDLMQIRYIQHAHITHVRGKEHSPMSNGTAISIHSDANTHTHTYTPARTTK